jgi:hypothetical protein
VDALGFEIGKARLQRIALERKLARSPVVIVDLLGAGQQVAARFAQELVGRGRAYLQRLKTGLLGRALVFRALVGFLERAGKPCALGIEVGGENEAFGKASGLAVLLRAKKAPIFRIVK